MEGAVLLDNSVGVEIHGDGILGLDCLVEAGSHTVAMSRSHKLITLSYKTHKIV